MDLVPSSRKTKTGSRYKDLSQKLWKNDMEKYDYYLLENHRKILFQHYATAAGVPVDKQISFA